jgi:hypothetical protein
MVGLNESESFGHLIEEPAPLPGMRPQRKFSMLVAANSGGLTASSNKQGRTVTLKMRFFDLEIINRSRSVATQVVPFSRMSVTRSRIMGKFWNRGDSYSDRIPGQGTRLQLTCSFRRAQTNG